MFGGRAPRADKCRAIPDREDRVRVAGINTEKHGFPLEKDVACWYDNLPFWGGKHKLAGFIDGLKDSTEFVMRGSRGYRLAKSGRPRQPSFTDRREPLLHEHSFPLDHAAREPRQKRICAVMTADIGQADRCER